MGLVYIFHVVICILLVLTILFQDGKAGGFSGVVDNAASQAVFGAKGAGDFLTKVTTYLATIFMVTSLTLAIYNSPSKSSIGDDFVPDETESSSTVEGSETAPTSSPFDINNDQTVDLEQSGAVIKDAQGNEVNVPLSDVLNTENVEVIQWEDAPQELKDQHIAEQKMLEEKKRQEEAAKGEKDPEKQE